MLGLIQYGIDMTGYIGPLILIVIYTYLIRKQKVYALWFIIFSWINLKINNILKGIIKDPRPINPIEFTADDKIIYKKSEQYGMPSAHVQSVAFSVTYLYLVKKSPMWLLIGIFVAGLTWVQRLKYRRHNISQLLGGAIIGSILGILSYLLVKRLA